MSVSSEGPGRVSAVRDRGGVSAVRGRGGVSAVRGRGGVSAVRDSSKDQSCQSVSHIF